MNITDMENKNSSFERIIDRMVEGKLQPSEAVDSILNGDSVVETVDLDVSGDESPDCPECGKAQLEAVQIESEDGDNVEGLHCPKCNTGFVPQEESEEDEEPTLREVDIDENDPQCPKCEGRNLESEVVESEGEEAEVVVCRDCEAVMIPAEN